jgi:pyruvate dehydrogenase E1 component alpha subunit
VTTLSKDELAEMYRRMLRIRLFDEKAIDLVSKGYIPGAVHMTIGQEGEVVGSCMALRADDYMTGNHRSHGHPIGKGADVKPLMAELLGKKTGVCHGKGGSMHLADFKVGSLGESGIVASALPIATGAGLSAQLRGTDQVCLAFFGDGGANSGAFHEAINLAAIWKLPVIYVCENNQYAVMTRSSDSAAVENIADRAASYSIPGVVVDGQDALAVHEVVSEAVRRARNGEGPSLVEAKTYRYREHAEFGGLDRSMPTYRSSQELESWRARDPVSTYRDRMIAEGLVSEADLDEIAGNVAAEIEEAVEFARTSPAPELEEAFEDLYSNPILIRR